MRNSKAHTWTERERLQQMKAHSRHKGLCRVSTGTEREKGFGERWGWHNTAKSIAIIGAALGAGVPCSY